MSESRPNSDLTVEQIFHLDQAVAYIHHHYGVFTKIYLECSENEGGHNDRAALRATKVVADIWLSQNEGLQQFEATVNNLASVCMYAIQQAYINHPS